MTAEPTNEQVAALSKTLREAAGITTTAGVLTECVRMVLAAAPAVQPAARPSVYCEACQDTFGGCDTCGGTGPERALAHPPAQGSESGGERLGLVTQALVRADEEFGAPLSAYRYRKLAEAVAAALSQPGPASEGDGE